MRFLECVILKISCVASDHCLTEVSLKEGICDMPQYSTLGNSIENLK